MTFLCANFYVCVCASCRSTEDPTLTLAWMGWSPVQSTRFEYVLCEKVVTDLPWISWDPSLLALILLPVPQSLHVRQLYKNWITGHQSLGSGQTSNGQQWLWFALWCWLFYWPLWSTRLWPTWVTPPLSQPPHHPLLLLRQTEGISVFVFFLYLSRRLIIAGILLIHQVETHFWMETSRMCWQQINMISVNLWCESPSKSPLGFLASCDGLFAGGQGLSVTQRKAIMLCAAYEWNRGQDLLVTLKHKLFAVCNRCLTAQCTSLWHGQQLRHEQS